MTGTFAVVSRLDRWLRRTVLTARGIEVWSLRGKRIPWSQIASVVADGTRWNIRYITVRRSHGHAFVRLPAPLAPFGIGWGRVEAARALVEKTWRHHKGDASPAQVSGYSLRRLWSPPSTK